MSTKYPSKIDDNISLPNAIDNVTPLKASVVNDLKDAIIAIEEELGVNPAGVSSDIKARFTSIETTLNNIQNISLDGDLGGTLAIPLVTGIQGKQISSTEPVAGQILYYNGLVWLPFNLPTEIFPFTEVQSGANYGNYLTIPLSINNNSTSSNIFTNISTFEFNKSLYKSAGTGTRTIKLKIIAETTGPEITVRIYNFTTGAAVTGTTLNSTSMINVLLETSDISSYLSTGSAIYNIQMSIDTVDPAENASLTYAALEIQWS